jgi:PPOX class probable F420-dependent enzyme
VPSLSEPTARRLVAEARSARISTIDPDGRPNLVPIVFVLDRDTLYSSVDAKPKESAELRRLVNIRANPEGVAVIVDHYEEEWPALWWVRMRGRGRVIEEGPERDRAHSMLRRKYRQYTEMPPQGAVVAVEVGEWRGWSWRPIE